jgi:hypothetical protein
MGLLIYFLRVPRITSRAPETSATALPADPALISGATAVAAIAKDDTPASNNIIPNAFFIRPPNQVSIFV